MQGATLLCCPPSQLPSPLPLHFPIWPQSGLRAQSWGYPFLSRAGTGWSGVLEREAGRPEAQPGLRSRTSCSSERREPGGGAEGGEEQEGASVPPPAHRVPASHWTPESRPLFPPAWCSLMMPYITVTAWNEDEDEDSGRRLGWAGCGDSAGWSTRTPSLLRPQCWPGTRGPETCEAQNNCHPTISQDTRVPGPACRARGPWDNAPARLWSHVCPGSSLF